MSTKDKNYKNSYDNILDEVVKEIEPIYKKKIDNRLMIAAKLEDALIEKRISRAELLKSLGKTSPSLITKYLSGQHNFTVDTLSALEIILGIDIFTPYGDLPVKSTQVPVSSFNIKSNNDKNRIRPMYNTIKVESSNTIEVIKKLSVNYKRC